MTLNEFKTAAAETLSNFFDVLFLQVPWGDAPMHYVMWASLIYILIFVYITEPRGSYRRSKNG